MVEVDENRKKYRSCRFLNQIELKTEFAEFAESDVSNLRGDFSTMMANAKIIVELKTMN